ATPPLIASELAAVNVICVVSVPPLQVDSPLTVRPADPPSVPALNVNAEVDAATLKFATADPPATSVLPTLYVPAKFAVPPLKLTPPAMVDRPPPAKLIVPAPVTLEVA